MADMFSTKNRLKTIKNVPNIVAAPRSKNVRKFSSEGIRGADFEGGVQPRSGRGCAVAAAAATAPAMAATAAAAAAATAPTNALFGRKKYSNY